MKSLKLFKSLVDINSSKIDPFIPSKLITKKLFLPNIGKFSFEIYLYIKLLFSLSKKETHEYNKFKKRKIIKNFFKFIKIIFFDFIKTIIHTIKKIFKPI